MLIENAMSNRQLKDYKYIKNYIAEHIGDVYTLIESGQKVYVGDDFPGEYVHSKYTRAIHNSNKIKAKNRAVSNLDELVEIAANRRAEKTKHEDSKDAAYGMYRYDTTFAFPLDGEVATYKAYDANILIRNASEGNKYLYDIVDLKENTKLVLSLNAEARRRHKAATQAGAFNNRITSADGKRNRKYSLTESDGREFSELKEPLYRFTNSENPMSEYRHAMFSDSEDRVEFYGRNRYLVDASKLTPFESVKPLIESAYDQDAEEDFRMMQNCGVDEFAYQDKESFVNSFNPEDIVESAEGYDNTAMNYWLYECVLEPNGIDGIRTQNGGVVYNEELVQSAGKRWYSLTDSGGREFSEPLTNKEKTDAMYKPHAGSVEDITNAPGVGVRFSTGENGTFFGTGIKPDTTSMNPTGAAVGKQRMLRQEDSLLMHTRRRLLLQESSVRR